MRNLLGLIICFSANLSMGADFSEQIKIAGFRCENGKAVILLRSLDSDRALFLSKNRNGDPKPLEMLQEHCEALIGNLGARLTNRVLDVEFHTDSFTRKESVYIPPRNHCRPGHTKCDDEGTYEDRIFNYVRTQVEIDGYRFFIEERK